VPYSQVPLTPLSPDDDVDEENIIHLTPEEEEKLRRDFGYIAHVLKKNLCIIVQEVTFPDDPRGDIIIDHSFKPDIDENGVFRDVKYSMLFWKSGLNHRRSIPPEHAILIILSLLENHETSPQFMYECGQNVKVAYGQLPQNLWVFSTLISRLEDMDYDDIVPDESELATRKRYRDTYIKFVNHFRRLATGIIHGKGREVPVNPEIVDEDLQEYEESLKKVEKRGRPRKSATEGSNKKKEPKQPKKTKEQKKLEATNTEETKPKRGRPRKVHNEVTNATK